MKKDKFETFECLIFIPKPKPESYKVQLSNKFEQYKNLEDSLCN